MIVSRNTVRDEITLEGFGLHSGEAVRVRFVPSQEGIRFVCGSTALAAIPENVSHTNRCTRLGEVGTIEHAMAALAGLEVTDVDVVLDTPELPALDGSARPYVEALECAGLESLGEVELAGPFARVFLHDGDCKLSVSAGEGEWRYEFTSPHSWPWRQIYETHDVAAEFVEQIAPARTFGFEAEVPAIEAAGLAKGLDLEKALLIGTDGYANAARFADEPARHKLLDAIGDLYLAGIPIRHLNVVAERTGHRMNVQAAKLLKDSSGS